MAEKVLMLALSPTMETGTIVKWLKKPGDTVSSGDIICEVETDKATMDYESIQEGTLRAILAEEGSSMKVGDTIAVIGSADEDISAMLKKETLPAETGGKSAKEEGPVSHREEKPEQTESPETDGKQSRRNRTRVFASPLAKQIARERGIPLESLQGSGPGGRIVKRDVEAGKTVPTADGVEKRQKASGKRLVIARRLAESMQQAPHYYEKVRVDMDVLFAARAGMDAGGKKKPSLNAFLIKFAAEALKKHPALRSSWQDDEIVTYGRIDIALAVALEDGLIAPVVRDCGSKGIVEIDTELTLLIEKARAGNLQPEDYSQAIFTISNLGAWGVEEFTAVINPPGSGILAVGAARREPAVMENGLIGVKTLAALTLSADHRVVDGAVAASFLVDLKRIIEYPVHALM